MAVITSGKTFANGEQLSASKLNQVITGATFNQADAVDGSTMTIIGGAMAVADEGIATGKIAPGAVNFSKLTDVLDEDNMSSDSATSLATQQSIKAYVDAGDADPARAYQSLTNSTVSDNVQQNTTGRPLWTSFTLYASGKDINFLLLAVSPNSDMSGGTRIGQSRISSDGSSDSGTQVTGIVPSNYYWKYAYQLASGTPTEMVHSSFIL
jgi:hypothetical protein